MKNTDTDSKMSLAQALKIIKCREGADFSLFKVNLAELERLTEITRARLRRLKANGFEEKEHGLIGTKQKSAPGSKAYCFTAGKPGKTIFYGSGRGISDGLGIRGCN